MNSPRPHGLLALVFTAVLSATTVEAIARPPRGRDADGVIESVDEHARTLRLRTAKTSKPMTLVWNSRSRFVEEARFVCPARLGAGALVTITYRAPLFGKPFATRILFRSALL